MISGVKLLQRTLVQSVSKAMVIQEPFTCKLGARACLPHTMGIIETKAKLENGT